MSNLFKRRITRFVVLLLAIELLDEVIYGMGEAAIPLIRDALLLDYVQIGLLVTVPKLVGNFIDPFIGIAGDTSRRRMIILGGGIVFAFAMWLIAGSASFEMLLVAFTVAYLASGAFVGLAQAALMDEEPERHEQNMARWTAAGSLGVVTGPLLLGAGLLLGGDWRGVYVFLGVITVGLVLIAWRYRFPVQNHLDETDEEEVNFRQSLQNALGALRKWEVWRWMILLEFSDLMLDILLGYLALYFVDVVGLTEDAAVIAISIWTGIGLVGDLAMVVILERIKGLVYLRYSAMIEFILYSAFLLAEPLWLKLVLLGLLGFFNAGWYAILQAQLYSALPNQSGSVMALSSIVGMFGGILPLLIGWLADQWGLALAMWFILAGPIALFIGLPRRAGGEIET